ncbi:MAG: SoxR reducing system RseC family protein [Treponema sp.]
MEKTGTIIKIPAVQTSRQQVVTVAFDEHESELCSIKSTDLRSGSRNSCTGCGGGCTACGRNNIETGLFAIQGNIVNALNTTGTELRIGKRVRVFVSEQAAFLQGVFAVGLPLLLSAVFFTFIFLQTKNETLALAGIAGGMAAGICIAFGIGRIVKERALPKIIGVYE